MFRAVPCSSSVCSPFSTGILYGRLQTVTIPEAVIIQFVLLKMSKLLLETCWGLYCNIYRVSHELRSLLRESIPYVKVYQYNPKHLHPKLNGYGDNDKRNLKVWQLLHTYWLPNSYWNWQEYVVSVMLISILNFKVTCEWHKAIKLNYKNTRTHITVVLKVTKHCTYRQ